MFTTSTFCRSNTALRDCTQSTYAVWRKMSVTTVGNMGKTCAIMLMRVFTTEFSCRPYCYIAIPSRPTSPAGAPDFLPCPIQRPKISYPSRLRCLSPRQAGYDAPIISAQSAKSQFSMIHPAAPWQRSAPCPHGSHYTLSCAGHRWLGSPR